MTAVFGVALQLPNRFNLVDPIGRLRVERSEVEVRGPARQFVDVDTIASVLLGKPLLMNSAMVTSVGQHCRCECVERQNLVATKLRLRVVDVDHVRPTTDHSPTLAAAFSLNKLPSRMYFLSIIVPLWPVVWAMTLSGTPAFVSTAKLMSPVLAK
jgi:hypothetical protein